MTERELLELAFKAYLPNENYIRMVNDAGYDYWNPLKDDGQALRLAVKLGVFDGGPEFAHFRALECMTGIGLEAATRRAIVRVAAIRAKDKEHREDPPNPNC